MGSRGVRAAGACPSAPARHRRACGLDSGARRGVLQEVATGWVVAEQGSQSTACGGLGSCSVHAVISSKCTAPFLAILITGPTRLHPSHICAGTSMERKEKELTALTSLAILPSSCSTRAASNGLEF